MATFIGMFMVFMFQGLLITAGICFYFLPTMVAAHNDKRNSAAIFMLNIFAGWTIVGWIGALVWSVCRD